MLYNLWLGLNIIYETLLPLLWLFLLLGAAWLASLVLALKQAAKPQWAAGLRISGLIGVAATVLMLVFGPALSSSDFGDMGYWVDWFFLIGSAVAAGVVLWLATWPLLAWLSKPRAQA